MLLSSLLGDITPQFLSYLGEPWHRETTIALVEKEYYNKHWLARCVELGNIPGYDWKHPIDYGWLYCLLSAARQRTYTVNVTSRDLSAVVSNLQSILARNSEWFEEISGNSWVASLQCCVYYPCDHTPRVKCKHGHQSTVLHAHTLEEDGICLQQKRIISVLHHMYTSISPGRLGELVEMVRFSMIYLLDDDVIRDMLGLNTDDCCCGSSIPTYIAASKPDPNSFQEILRREITSAIAERSSRLLSTYFEEGMMEEDM